MYNLPQFLKTRKEYKQTKSDPKNQTKSIQGLENKLRQMHQDLINKSEIARTGEMKISA